MALFSDKYHKYLSIILVKIIPLTANGFGQATGEVLAYHDACAVFYIVIFAVSR